ncbi:MAG: cadmium-translocating P-type ATPase, partial [Oscillospiraceae bacterium]|nr:cadmium-translocating P-type ATPase [Oscillospiraceae bacterium]
MKRKQKRVLVRIIVSAVLFAVYLAVPVENDLLKLVLALIPFGVIGWDILYKSVRNIAHGQIFDENFLMSIASVGSFLSGYLSGSGDYAEGTAVMLFYQVGELFQSIAVNSSRKSISSLMDIRPDTANVENADMSVTETDPEEVEVGSIIVVRPGERVPIDGIIESGSASIDTSALTGESVPRDVAKGDEVISGCISLNGVLRVRTTKNFGDSTVSKILELVENSASKKSKAENFITKFAKYYTPVVVIAAAVLAVIPSLFTGDWNTWINRALIFLVISCPCALVISVPLSFFGGIGRASKSGILIKGGNYLEAVSKAEIIVFDKTGTLTQGVFNVTDIYTENISQQQLIEYSAHAESFSSHPIALSIVRKYGKAVDNAKVSEYTEIAGFGVQCSIDGKSVLVGNDRLMKQNNISFKQPNQTGTAVHVAVNGVYAGYLIISDEVKSDSQKAVSELKKSGIKTVMLTGDSKNAGEKITEKLCIDRAYCELLPDNKVEIVENLMNELSADGKLIFVGDGINDAPVISRADVGIAMGAAGSDAAIEAADIVLMDDKPSKIAEAMNISRKTLSIAYQNIVFALGVKILVLILGTLGLANMWAAVFADVGVSVIAILNAMRT